MNDPHAGTPTIEPRPAATVVLVRDGSNGPQVLLLRRDHAAVFAAGAHVFPGGRVDAADAAPALAALCDGIDDVRASAVVGLEQGGLAYWVAAIRECYEEAGLLLATGDQVRTVAADSDLREALMAGELTLEAICRRRGLRLAAGALSYFGHWITPKGPPRRFDTRFFIAPSPPGQEACACLRETFDPCWMRPEEALSAARKGRIKALYPTIKTLESLEGHHSAQSMLEAVRASSMQAPTRQSRCLDGTGRR